MAHWCNTHFLRLIKFCRSNSALGSILKINSIGGDLALINLPKVAFHDMAYFIFLKYLRSLEEFRENPHVKIPPKFPCANFQSLDKFKNPIFNSKTFLLHFRPGYPYRPTRPSAQPAPLPPLLPQAEANFVGPRAPLSYLQKYVFFFDSRLPLSAPSLYPPTDTWAPLVGFTISTALANPGRVSTAPPLPRCPLHTSDAAEPLPPPITP
jgi:hypothetical protein